MGTSTSSDPCDDLPRVTWAGWTSGFFTTWCRACHSQTTSDRFGAPEGLDFDTERQVATWAEQIRTSVLEEERMPRGGGVDADERYLLEVYLACELGI